MALGDGTTWDETTPTNATVATSIDDYNMDLRKGVRNRMALEHEWPSSQSATSEAGVHKFMTLQQQGAAPTLAGTQVGSVYLGTDDVVRVESALMAAMPVPRIVQIVSTEDGAVATGTTTMTRDDSKPQITEGDEYMTLAITPTATANKLLVDVVFNYAVNAADIVLVAGLFQGTTADAVAAIADYDYRSDRPNTLSFSKYLTAATAGAAITFSLRFGQDGTGNTVTFNGVAGNRKLGGAMASSITIYEIGV